jgi:hypothetical protein
MYCTNISDECCFCSKLMSTFKSEFSGFKNGQKLFNHKEGNCRLKTADQNFQD